MSRQQLDYRPTDQRTGAIKISPLFEELGRGVCIKIVKRILRGFFCMLVKQTNYDPKNVFGTLNWQWFILYPKKNGTFSTKHYKKYFMCFFEWRDNNNNFYLIWTVAPDFVECKTLFMCGFVLFCGKIFFLFLHCIDDFLDNMVQWVIKSVVHCGTNPFNMQSLHVIHAKMCYFSLYRL